MTNQLRERWNAPELAEYHVRIAEDMNNRCSFRVNLPLAVFMLESGGRRGAALCL